MTETNIIDNMSWTQKIKKFLLSANFGFVVLPVLLGSIYIFLLAADRYVSESKFTVKSEHDSATSNMALPFLSGVSSGAQDQFIIRDYILSMDMMDKVTSVFGDAFVLQGPSSDLLWSLPDDATRIDKLNRFQSMVQVHYDDEASITMLTVQNFNAEMAQKVNQFILDESVKFVNEFSTKMAEDSLHFAEVEVDRAKKKTDEALNALNDFQDKNGLLNPESDSTSVMGTISGLESTLASEKAKLNELISYMNENAPQVQGLKARIASLEEQIASFREKLAGNDPDRLSDSLKEFAILKSNLELANEIYATAITGLEAARVKAARTQKHMMVIVSPTLPDTAVLPMRTWDMIFFVVFVLAVNLLGRVGIAVIKEYS